jgi:hypothetical protein
LKIRADRRRTSTRVLIGGCPFPVPITIVLFLRRIQPLLDEIQHVGGNNPTSNTFHQFGVRDAVKIT